MVERAISPTIPLAVNDHRRDIVGFRYVYPVVSRRAGGVSVGINLNPNNACNWRCVYCQVPDLVRGNAPEIDLALLETELVAMLNDVVHGDFMQRSVPAEARRLNDLALSGNGEPTSSRQFGDVITLLGRQLAAFGLLGKIKLVLITNGSQLYKASVQQALGDMAALNGEVWFKYDRAPVDGMSDVNQVALTPAQIQRHLIAATRHCPTWIQTCMFAVDGAPPDVAVLEAWLALLAEAQAAGATPQGVLLYGLARPSTQPEAPRLSRLPEAWMQGFAATIERELALPVKWSV